MAQWLCDLAMRLSRLAFRDLTKAHESNGRFALSEENVTAAIITEIYDSALQWGHPERVWVRGVPRAEEEDIGADLEIWFTLDHQTGFGWRIQAKRLSPGGPLSPPRFEYLAHQVGAALQVDLLIDSCDGLPNLVPVYWLYSFNPNPAVACDRTAQCRCGARSLDRGLLVAGAHRVKETLASAAVEPRSFHTWGGMSWPRALPLSAYWCATTSVPPGVVFDALRASSRRFDPNDDPPDDGPLPPYVRTLMDTARDTASDGSPLADSGEARSRAVAVLDLS